MNLTPILNLLIPQGSDLSDLTFQLRHKTMLRCPAVKSLTPSSIKIEQLGVSMLAGEKLIIGCDELVLSQNLDSTDTVVNVTSIPSSIPNRAILVAKPINITGWRFRSTIKDLQGLDIANFTCSIVDPLDGRFKAYLPSSITTGINANCNWREYQGLDISSLGQPLDLYQDSLSSEALKRLKKLNDRAYKWDLESIDLDSMVVRRVQGLVLVSGEVTTSV